jgi:hypothetical protein
MRVAARPRAFAADDCPVLSFLPARVGVIEGGGGGGGGGGGVGMGGGGGGFRLGAFDLHMSSIL